MSRSPFSLLRPCIPARSSSSVVTKFYPFQIVHPNGWTVRKVRGTSAGVGWRRCCQLCRVESGGSGRAAGACAGPEGVGMVEGFLYARKTYDVTLGLSPRKGGADREHASGGVSGGAEPARVGRGGGAHGGRRGSGRCGSCSDRDYPGRLRPGW